MLLCWVWSFWFCWWFFFPLNFPSHCGCCRRLFVNAAPLEGNVMWRGKERAGQGMARLHLRVGWWRALARPGAEPRARLTLSGTPLLGREHLLFTANSAETRRDLTVNECHRKGGVKPQGLLSTAEVAKQRRGWGMDDTHKHVPAASRGACPGHIYFQEMSRMIALCFEHSPMWWEVRLSVTSCLFSCPPLGWGGGEVGAGSTLFS